LTQVSLTTFVPIKPANLLNSLLDAQMRAVREQSVESSYIESADIPQSSECPEGTMSYLESQ
jgi:hypothetical protein